MRLFEAVLEANQRRVAGDRAAMIPAADHASALPIAALTCIDARLNHVLPDALGIPEEHFIWLRNAGNIITGPLSSTMRSLALACAVKGAKEIAIIGHSDCLVGKTTAMQILDRLAAMGVDRHKLPDNVVEYFGLFASERQNVIRGVEIARSSPLIGSKVPVHGLLIDLGTGRVEWVVNGYEPAPVAVAGPAGEIFAKADQALNAFARIGSTAASELKLPETKIGEIVSLAEDWLHRAEKVAAVVAPAKPVAPAAANPPTPPPAPPKIPAQPNPLFTLQERMRQMAAKAQNRRPPR
ncbi:MAG TPA: carbonic anhydrase [Opitutaceae bacterium]|nr:carbonic anhydrase [Opitutaceae bacterium]